MMTNADYRNALIDDITRTLKSAEENWETEFWYAIREIGHANTEMYVFGMHEHVLYDQRVLSAIKSASNAERFYIEVKQLYEDVIARFGC